MSVVIKEVKTKRELKKFVWFGINMYKDNPYAAPPLAMDDLLNLSKGKNPALDFCDTAYFLAYKEGKIVGRIAGIIQPVANETWDQKHARFGWIDFVDDPEVSNALFDAVERWAKSKGMTHIHGPLGFTDFDNEGALIEGYDRPGTLATIYNYPYYIEHYERLGFEKEADWVEYLITVPDVFPEKFIRMAEIVKRKFNLHPVQLVSKKDTVERYGQKIFDLLNEAYKDLFGFAKLTDEQIQFYIKLYFSFFRLDTVVLVENDEGDLIALGIAMPSFTKALQKVKGKLFPFGWYHMLKAIKKNDLLDLYLIAVHPDYQNKGVNAILFAEMMPVAAKNGYVYAESNPELETNTKITAHWDYFEHEIHKKRRVYIKAIK
jgi:GNAT superfamily N-acetyltransferase